MLRIAKLTFKLQGAKKLSFLPETSLGRNSKAKNVPQIAKALLAALKLLFLSCENMNLFENCSFKNFISKSCLVSNCVQLLNSVRKGRK